MNILNEIAEKTRERIERDKKEMPREDLINEIRQKKVQMLLPGTEKTGNVLYLRGQKSLPVKGNDRIGFSVSGDRERV